MRRTPVPRAGAWHALPAGAWHAHAPFRPGAVCTDHRRTLSLWTSPRTHAGKSLPSASRAEYPFRAFRSGPVRIDPHSRSSHSSTPLYHRASSLFPSAIVVDCGCLRVRPFDHQLGGCLSKVCQRQKEARSGCTCMYDGASIPS